MAEDRGGAPGAWSPFEFLTAGEKDTFAEWSAEAEGAQGPLGGRPLLPETLAPSLLDLAGTLLVVEAWSFAEAYGESAPALASLVGAAASALCWCLWELGRSHGRRAMLDTPLVELFRHVCGLVAFVFLAALACPLLAGPRPDVQWSCVQMAQLCLMWMHYESLLRGCRAGSASLGGILLVVTCLLLLRSGWGHEPLLRPGLGALGSVGPLALPFTVGCLLVLQVLLFSPGEHLPTQRVLCATLALRGAGLLLRAALAGMGLWRASPTEAVCEGLLMAMVSSDLVLARMAQRELHPAVAVASAAAVVPIIPILSLCLAGAYHVAVFADLRSHLGMPLFGVCRNVYCDGIYDLCHIGHKNMFRRASKLGHRLLVGVVGDKDANEYKRPPVMTAAEREAEVAGCKGVTKVISNAPCFGLTEEFLRKHRIHVVAYGQEYADRFPNPDDDPYYRVPRKLGIAVPQPRTECFSTSELLERVRKVEAADLEKKSPT